MLAALADVVRVASSRLPAFLLIIDDDTFVNSKALRRFLAHLDPENVTYMGDYRKASGYPFLYGGGGHLISRALLRGLLAREEKTHR